MNGMDSTTTSSSSTTEGVSGFKFLFTRKNRHNFFNPPNISDNTRFQSSYKDSLKKNSWEIVIDYFLEWMSIVIIGILAAILFNVEFPYTLYFRLDDPSIQYPNIGTQTVSLNLIVTLFIFVVPAIIIVLFQLVFIRNLHDFHHLVLGTIQSLAFNMMFMLFFWFFYPAYRPNFLQTCNPIPEKIIQVALTRAQPYNNVIYFLPQEICSDPSRFTKMKVNNTPGFPSGHASNLFSVWIFVVLYLFAKFKALSSYSRIGKTINRAISVPRRGWFIFPCIVLLIIGAAIWIGVFSRILDYEHMWIQVISGTILGFIIPIFVYSFKFGSAFGPDSHIPLYYYWTSSNTH